MKLGDKVLHHGFHGEIVALSGADGKCIVRYDIGIVTRWIPQDEVIVKKKEGEQ